MRERAEAYHGSPMEILSTSESDLRRAGKALAEGLLVAIPTETVYGLGANAFDERAVARVFEAKARPNFDPLIVHIASLDTVEQVATVPSEKARRLMKALWPGPLTLIMPKRPEIPGIVSAGLSTVAVRFPSNEVAQAVIRYSGVPVAAPSANPFGYLSPSTARHVADFLGDKVDFIVDGGPCAIGVESTVLDVTQEPPRVLRPGGMPVESIEAVIGPVAIGVKVAADADGAPAPQSPGQLKSHYAPHTPLYLLPEGRILDSEPRGRAVALVFSSEGERALRGSPLSRRFSEIRVLSPSGDFLEASAALFSILHVLDLEGLDEIWAERLPERGLGRAVNDRLYKASEKDGRR
jgi:L-threonylcarbamoyladenylate synthase